MTRFDESQAFLKLLNPRTHSHRMITIPIKEIYNRLKTIMISSGQIPCLSTGGAGERACCVKGNFRHEDGVSCTEKRVSLTIHYRNTKI